MARQPGKRLRLKATDIFIDPRLQARADGTDQGHVDDLHDALKGGAKLPELKIRNVPEVGMCLTDGHHTFHAGVKKGVKEFDCVVQEGTWLDAVADACGANDQHNAKKRTGKDKTNAVVRLVKEVQKSGEKMWGQNRIAEACKVSSSFVKKVFEDHKLGQKDDDQTSAQVSTTTVDAPAEPKKVVDRRGREHVVKPSTPKPEPVQPLTAEELAKMRWRDIPLAGNFSSIANVQKAVFDAGLTTYGELYDALNSEAGIPGVGPYNAPIEMEKIERMKGFDGKRRVPTPKNGAVKFDFAAWESNFGRVIKGWDDMATAYAAKGKHEFQGGERMLRAFEKLYQDQKKLLTAEKPS